VLRVLLDHAGGRAECCPSNTKIGEIVGLQGRAIKYVLRHLERCGTILCIYNRTLDDQRVIVLMNHPGTLATLKATGAKGYTRGGNAVPGGRATSCTGGCT